MQLAGNAGPFLFADFLKVVGQVPQLLTGLSDFFSGLLFDFVQVFQGGRHLVERPSQLAEFVLSFHRIDAGSQIASGQPTAGGRHGPDLPQDEDLAAFPNEQQSQQRHGSEQAQIASEAPVGSGKGKFARYCYNQDDLVFFQGARQRRKRVDLRDPVDGFSFQET